MMVSLGGGYWLFGMISQCLVTTAPPSFASLDGMVFALSSFNSLLLCNYSAQWLHITKKIGGATSVAQLLQQCAVKAALPVCAE